MALLLLCLVGFVLGLVLRSIGKSMVRQYERQMMEAQYASHRRETS